MKREAINGIMLTLLLTGMLASASGVHPVKASGTIYIKADGSIDPDTAPISGVDLVTYTFTDNIYDEIVVERDNIVIDGGGYTLQGAGSGRGIDLTGRSNVTIRNTEIRSFGSCIWLEGSSNNTVSGNNMTNNGGGIPVIHSSNYNSLSGNNITGNSWSGIEVGASSNYNSVCDNTIADNGDGIQVYWSSNYNTISRNSITGNGDGITIYGTASYNTVSGNNITSNGGYGIWLRSSPNNTIFHNNIMDNGVQAYDLSPSQNDWHHPALLEGNYWSGYPGVDDGSGSGKHAIAGDGIGDTDIPWPSTDYDFYPFVEESGWIRTMLTVDTDPRTVNKIGSETTKIFGRLKSGETGLGGKTVKLYYQYASTEYGYIDGTWTHIASVATDTGGYYEHYWNPDDTLENGYYCIRAEFEGDPDYQPCSATTGVDLVPNLFVIPEYMLGTILGLAACITALAVFKSRRAQFTRLSIDRSS